MQAATIAQPAARDRDSPRDATHSAVYITASMHVPISIGSVIGVLWRKSRLGLSINIAAPTPPASTEPVVATVRRVSAQAAIAMLAIDSAIADAPDRYQ